MKITRVEMQAEGAITSASFISLNFRDPQGLEPYNVKSISGLDAEDIFPQFYGTDGAAANFYNMVMQSRVIVVKVGLRPNPRTGLSTSELRDNLYKNISGARTGTIKLVFYNGNTSIAAVSGYVTKVETPHFEKNQEVQITINCSDSLLRDENFYSMPLLNADPALTLIQDDISTAPHGVDMGIHVLSNVFDFKITDVNSNMTFKVHQTFLVNDVILLSTEIGRRSITFVRGSTTRQLTDKIIKGSFWPVIFPGENMFSLDNPTSFEYTSIGYYKTYWGV